MTPLQIVTANVNATDAEIAAILNAQSVEVRDTEKWTSAGLARAIGVANFGRLDEVLKSAPGMDWVRMAMASQGLDLSQPEIQAGVDSLRPAIGNLADMIKQIGIRHLSPWAASGREGQATEQDVIDLRADIAALALRTVNETHRARLLNQIINPAIDAGKSWPDILADIATDNGGE